MGVVSQFATFLTPWPVSNLIKIAAAPPLAKDAPPAATRYAEPPWTASLETHAAVVAGNAWKLIFSLLVYRSVVADYSAAQALDVAWILRVILRDM